MEVQMEDPREVNVEDVDIGAMYGRVLKWNDLNMQLNEQVNAVAITMEALCQQEMQVHFRVLVNGIPSSYEFLCGGQGNTEVNILKRGVKGKEVDVACVFCGRICSDTTAGTYWFQLALFPSTNADKPAHMELSMGLGSDLGQRLVIAARVDVDVSQIQLESVGITSGRSPLKARNVTLRSLLHAYVIPSDAELVVMSDPSGTDLLTPQQREDYNKACEAARKRAERFGGEFHRPDIKQFLDSKVIRMMQRSGAVSEKGFATGFDVMSAEETAKREKRRQRFNLTMDYDIKAARQISEGMSEEEVRRQQEELAKRESRAAKFGAPSATSAIDLVAASGKVLAERVDLDESLEVRPDALHMYSLDNAFTSVRTRDILSYFSGYGPSYVEWINDSACTIVFDDAFTVSRALLALTSELPAGATLQRQPNKESNPFAKKSDQEEALEQQDQVPATAWRYGLPIKAADYMDRTWRVLLRRATLKDFPPEKTWKRQQYQQSSHRRMQRLPKRKRHRDDDRRDDERRENEQRDEQRDQDQRQDDDEESQNKKQRPDQEDAVME